MDEIRCHLFASMSSSINPGRSRTCPTTLPPDKGDLWHIPSEVTSGTSACVPALAVIRSAGTVRSEPRSPHALLSWAKLPRVLRARGRDFCTLQILCLCLSNVFSAHKIEKLEETQLGPVRYNPHPEPSQGDRDLPSAMSQIRRTNRPVPSPLHNPADFFRKSWRGGGVASQIHLQSHTYSWGSGGG